MKSATGEIIKHKVNQMKCWVEYYSENYARENTVTKEALDAAECMHTLEELDATPSMNEISKISDTLTTGKAPGKDGIPSEIIKSAKGPFLGHLHKLLCLFWREGVVPQDMRDENIIILYENKGDRSD